MIKTQGEAHLKETEDKTTCKIVLGKNRPKWNKNFKRLQSSSEKWGYLGQI